MDLYLKINNIKKYQTEQISIFNYVKIIKLKNQPKNK